MPNGNPRDGFFYPIRTLMILFLYSRCSYLLSVVCDSTSCLPDFFSPDSECLLATDSLSELLSFSVAAEKKPYKYTVIFLQAHTEHFLSYEIFVCVDALRPSQHEISKILNLRNLNFKTYRMPSKMNSFKFK